MTHNIKLIGYSASSFVPLVLGTKDSYGVEKIRIKEKTKEWEGLDITVTFNTEKSSTTMILNEDGECDVPNEATDFVDILGMFNYIEFAGTRDGVQILSTKLPYMVLESGNHEGENTKPPEPSIYEQFVNEVREDAESAKDSKEKAEKAAKDVEDYTIHPPKIIDEYWYIWDIDVGDYIKTDARASSVPGPKGDDGIGIADIATNKEEKTTEVKITLSDGTEYTFNIDDGKDGKDGDKGDDGNGIAEVTTEKVGLKNTVTMTFTDGSTTTFDVFDGKVGVDGVGISEINTEETETGHNIEIILTNGNKTSFSVTDGHIGKDGDPGKDGIGISEIISKKTDKTTTITVKLSDGTEKSFDIKDGEDGEPGTIDEKTMEIIVKKVEEDIGEGDISAEAEGVNITIENGTNSPIKSLSSIVKNDFDQSIPTPTETVTLDDTLKFTITSGDKSHELEIPNMHGGYLPLADAANLIIDGRNYVGDEIDFETGKITRRVQVLKLNGTEGWAAWSSPVGFWRLNAAAKVPEAFYGSEYGTAKNALLECSHYARGENFPRTPSQIESHLNKIGIGKYSIIICDTRFDHISKWINYLKAQYAAGTPVTVHYVLKNPIVEDIPEGVMKAYKALKTFDGLNTITENAKSKIEYWLNFKHKPYVDAMVEGNTQALDAAQIGYITPEMYGAIGDGIADDTDAVTKCVKDGLKKKLPVHLSGNYRTTAPIDVSCNDAYIEINKLNYTGTDAAFIIEGTGNKVKIGRIDAPNGYGLRLRAVTNISKFNDFDISSIYAGKDCIDVYCEEYPIFQNTIKFNLLSAGGSDYACYRERSNPNPSTSRSIYVSEMTLTGGQCMRAGWAVISGGGNNKFYNIQLETLDNGIWLKGTETALISGLRYAELERQHSDANGISPTYDEGIGQTAWLPDKGRVIKLSAGSKGIKFIGSCPLYYNSIDVSECRAWASSEHNTYAAEWYNTFDVPIFFGHWEKTAGGRFEGQWAIAPGMITVSDLKFLKPGPDKKTITVTESEWTGLSATLVDPIPSIYPDTFKIDYNGNVRINLEKSYNPFSRSEIFIDQSKNGKAAVYDSYGRKIFDGTTKEKGIYKLICSSISNYQYFYPDAAYIGNYWKWDAVKVDGELSNAEKVEIENKVYEMIQIELIEGVF